MKKIIYTISAILMSIPINSLALTNDFVELIKTEKYYKTLTFYPKNYNSINNTLNYSSITEEISKEEYDSISNSELNYIKTTSLSVETTYKKMVTTISSNSSTYRYKNVLYWKLNPKIRSYDIIAIGHYASVKPKKLNFLQTYCYGLDDCYLGNIYTEKKTSTGSAAIFKVPVGNFVSMKQEFYFDVEKADKDTTIIKQFAVGDYSHATKSVSLSNAQKLSININGITLNSSIQDYYDDINPANATWEGNW